MYQRICSPILWVVFLFCWWFLLPCKIFLVWYSLIYLFFSFVSLVWGDISNKILLWVMSEILLPMCSMWFRVWGLIFKSLIHFEFILVCGVKRPSSFIFVYVSVQYSQHHLLNKLSLTHCMCLLPLLSINWL